MASYAGVKRTQSLRIAMKYFTEPNGQFVIKVPIEWQYCNVAAGYKEESPFSFAPYDEPASAGAFQISCYSATERMPRYNVQPSDKDNLDFIEKRMDDDEMNVHLWFCTVEDYVLMAKYIYEKKRANSKRIKEELRKCCEVGFANRIYTNCSEPD